MASFFLRPVRGLHGDPGHTGVATFALRALNCAEKVTFDDDGAHFAGEPVNLMRLFWTHGTRHSLEPRYSFFTSAF